MIAIVQAYCWGKQARFAYLFFIACILLFGLLDGREIWTLEERWVTIVWNMFASHDFLHPYYNDQSYYDKPLLSYWIMAGFSQLIGGMSVWSLRLPSAFSGLLTIYCLYQLGATLKNQSLGLLAAWLLTTTYYFIFWSRISSADMLNVAGIYLALTWYFQRQPFYRFSDFSVLYGILAVTALCKGLIGAIIPVLAITVDLSLKQHFKSVLAKQHLYGLTLALLLYLLPFFLSGWGLNQSGLYGVYKENFLRYFYPFDHKDPFYAYFIYLPVYSLPWSLLYLPALIAFIKNYARLPVGSKWLGWSLCILFLFLSLSGSRRSYYILPLVPLGSLFIADWLLNQRLYQKIVASLIPTSLVFILVTVMIIPAWYYDHYGVKRFTALLKKTRALDQFGSNVPIVSVDSERKIMFYLGLPLSTDYHSLKTQADLSTFKHQLDKTIKYHPKAIIISRMAHADWLTKKYKNYQAIYVKNPKTKLIQLDGNMPIALIPKFYE